MENDKQANFELGQVMSMLESMDDGIKLIGEQHGEIIKRLGGVETRLGGVETELGDVKVRLGGLEGKVDGLEGKFDRMQEDITEIKHRLADKVDREEFEKLEKRVVKMEQMVLAKQL
jgi:hypothetical protein